MYGRNNNRTNRGVQGGRPRRWTRSASRRRGVTALLAMLFLVLFSTLAIGFYAATTTSSQIASTDETIARSYLAAESGMDFMRYQLANVKVGTATPSYQVLDKLYASLQTQLNGTYNITNGPEANRSIVKNGNTISIPGPAGSLIYLDNAHQSGFHVMITDTAGEIVVKVDGAHGGTTVGRAFQMDFSRQQKATSVFDNAVFSEGGITIKKGAITTTTGVDAKIATVMSALSNGTSITMTGGLVGGKLTIMDDATVSVSGGSVDGATMVREIMDPTAGHITQTSKAPDMPDIDPTAYKVYATNPFVASTKKTTRKNTIIRAGTGTPSSPVIFNANDTLQGILYIESPNCVKFMGDFTCQGFIVMEKSPTSPSTDYLDFRGNFAQDTVPNKPEFDNLRVTTGISLLAPTASVAMSGSVDSIFKGNVICDKFSFAGSANIQFDNGSLITLNPNPGSATFNGKTVLFSSTGASNMPQLGFNYSQFFSPKPSTYAEVTP